MEKVIKTLSTCTNIKLVYFERNGLIATFATNHLSSCLLKQTFLISNDCKTAEITKSGTMENPLIAFRIFTYQPDGRKFFMLNPYETFLTKNIYIYSNEGQSKYAEVDNSIKNIAVSYNGNKLYGLDYSGNVIDVKTKAHITGLKLLEHVSCFAINNDGSIIALAYMNGSILQFYDTKSGKLLYEFKCDLPVSYMSFNKDGSKLVAAACNNHLHIYNIELMLGKMAKDMLIRGITDKSSNINKSLVCNSIYDYHLVGLIAGFIAR